MSAMTPTICRHVPGRSGQPCLRYLPSGSSPGQIFAASASMMTTTGVCAVRRSEEAAARQARAERFEVGLGDRDHPGRWQQIV